MKFKKGYILMSELNPYSYLKSGDLRDLKSEYKQVSTILYSLYSLVAEKERWQKALESEIEERKQ